MRSKLLDLRCQVQSPVLLVLLLVRSLPWLFQKLRKYGLRSLRKTPRKALPLQAQVPKALVLIHNPMQPLKGLRQNLSSFRFSWIFEKKYAIQNRHKIKYFISVVILNKYSSYKMKNRTLP